MLTKTCLFLLLFVTISLCTEIATKKTIEEGKQKLGGYVRAILDHYKQKNPVGLPGVPIPDPMDIPPLTQSFSVGKMTMTNIKLHGLKKFKIHHVKVDLAQMKSEVAVTIDRLDVYGNYTLKSLFSSSAGPFTIKLKEVYGQAIATLEVERDGYLEAQEINMDIKFNNIDMNFERLGFLSGIFQNMMNSVGSFVFDSIKPFVLKEANANIRSEVNKRTKEIPQTFPNSISPFDQLMSMARQMVRKQGFDPYRVKDYNRTVGLVGVEMTHTWLTGISSFHRVGNISFVLANDTLRAHMEIGTQRLQGTSNWEVGIAGGLLSRAGTVRFSLEYVKVGIVLLQSMDTRNKPQLEDIQLELGNIQVRFDGAGTLDYIIEFSVNVLPNILRYQLMDALETPVKRRIQEELNYINVEKLIMENVEKYDEGDTNFVIPIKI